MITSLRQGFNLLETDIEYRCEDRKKVRELRADIGAISQVLTPSFRKPRSSPPKNEPFSQEMHLKIPLLSRGLKSSSSKPVCRISAIHFFVKGKTPMGFWHRVHSDKCFFSFLFQDQPLFHYWKAIRGLKLSRNLRTPKSDHIHIYSLWNRFPRKKEKKCYPNSWSRLIRETGGKGSSVDAWWQHVHVPILSPRSNQTNKKNQSCIKIKVNHLLETLFIPRWVNRILMGLLSEYRW